MEKEKRTRGITDVLLILVITILAGTVLILAWRQQARWKHTVFSSVESLEHLQDLQKFL